MEEVVKYLKALLALQISQMEQSDGTKPPKPAVALARAGLSYKEIGALLGCSENAVKKAMQRAKAAEQALEPSEAA